MKILITGANGYIGKRLLMALLNESHNVICSVREKSRFHFENKLPGTIEVVEADFLDPASLQNIPKDIDAAYYLIHSMTTSTKDFSALESQTAINFRDYMNTTSVKQVIYLGGIINDPKLSSHLKSRKQVEEILGQGIYSLTTLRAGIIIGSGSASFEIMRDLVEKLPVMIAPKWLKTKSQPIAVRDIIRFLTGVLMNEKCLNKSFDIGGPDILDYREMLLRFAAVRNLKRTIITVPVMTPRLSSYWLYFVTSTSYPLAVNLVNSMKVEVVSRDNELQDILGIKPIKFEEAVEKAFDRIDQNEIISSWKDSLISSHRGNSLNQFIQVPIYGCFRDTKQKKVRNVQDTIEKIWMLGGKTGWYYGNWLWKIRGFMDRFTGGIGLRRGRTHPSELSPGDALDFWRVLLADKKNRRLLLYAEMNLPGEAWLEFHIDENSILHQTATFRPKGLKGRLYWYSLLPFHIFIFNGLIQNLSD